MYEAIGRPLEPDSLRLKNRIAFSPSTLGLAGREYEEALRRIAAGCCYSATKRCWPPQTTRPIRRL